ncbi:hypothetical protein C8Q74DRAFT_670846 [Fomes fomentarius]|nr:hypothetical protein C8Q74DRAFT_670846 [Fomes fomentarius]
MPRLSHHVTMMPAVSEFDPHFYLTWNLGIILSGLAITAVLFGFSTAQFGFYLRNYWCEDRSMVRSTVAVVWSLDFVHLVMYGHAVFYFLVIKHSDFAGQDKFPWGSYGQMVVNSILITVVQTFYLVRVWSISRQALVLAALGMVVAADFAMGMVLTTKNIIAGHISAVGAFTNFIVAVSALTASADILITATLVVLLIMSKASGARSRRLIHRLVFYTVNTGILTSVAAILSLITNVVMARTAVYVLFYYLSVRCGHSSYNSESPSFDSLTYPKVYTVSMIASLNAREGLRNQLAEGPRVVTTIPHITTTGPDHDTSVQVPTLKSHSDHSVKTLFSGRRVPRRNSAVPNLPVPPPLHYKSHVLDPDANSDEGHPRAHTLTLP